MKKLLAFLLSLCLVTSCIYITPTVFAEDTYNRFAWDFSVAPAETTGYKSNNTNATAALTHSVSNGSLNLSIASEFTTSYSYVYKIDVTGLKANTTYHYSVDYTILSGTVSKLVFGAYNSWSSATYLINSTSNLSFTPIIITSPAATNTKTSVCKTFTTSETTKPSFIYLGFMATGLFSVEFDNLVVSEVIDDNGGVQAATSNETMGTAAVSNANAAYTDFAKGETAVYTANANSGYRFTHWKNENGESVSTDANYTTTLNTDITLTAHFEEVKTTSISFNTNGGNSLDPVKGEAGTLITLPTPKKSGYHFAGWYTDADCSIPFAEKYFPKNDTTLYAKWFIGLRQDFENYTVSSYNPYNAEVIEDDTLTFSGKYAVKLKNDGTSNKTVRVIIPSDANDRLDAVADYGDKVTIQLKYRVVSGSATYYAHMAKSVTDSRLENVGITSSANYVNPFVYMGNTLSAEEETLNTWQTATQSYSIKTAETIKTEFGFEDAADAMKYPQLYFTVAAGSEIYIDDIQLYRSVNVPISYQTEAVRISPSNDKKSLTSAMVGDTVAFYAECDETVTPTVTYGDQTLTVDANGLYSIVVTDDDTLSVTSIGQTDAQNHAPGVGLDGKDLTKYDDDVFMNKVWQGDTVYHEAVMFVNSSDGTVQTTKKLLYPIDDIISVRNDDLDEWYVKGVDFTVEDGKLVWLPDGKCPIWTKPLIVSQTTEDDYVDPELSVGGRPNVASAYPTDDENGLYLIYDGYHEDRTLYVTYKHSTTWEEKGEEGYTPKVPENQSYDMKNFYDKLATDEDINVLVYGDSVATGCESTGKNMNYDLFDEDGTVILRSEGGGKQAPTFFEQATNELVKKYGNNNNIHYYNIAKGGKAAAWGAENLKTRVGYMNDYYGETIVPDIIYVKFAGNDAKTTPESYRDSFKSIIAQFNELYPNATIVLVSGKLNNEKALVYGDNHNNMLDLEQVLSDLADATPNCVVAKTTSVWDEITESKNYEDYLSNNINHANDFWAMVTSQIIVASTEKNENVSGVKTAYNNAAALRPAGASSTGKNGLRVYNEIKKEWIESANIVEYGSVALRTNKLNGAELTIQNGVRGVAYSDGTHSAAKSQLWADNDGAYVYTSYLTNIPEKFYGDEYSVRSYAIDKDGKVYYGDVVSVSVFAIANAIDNSNSADGSAPTEGDIAAFYTFVTDTNYSDYETWCADNDKSVGTLYADKYSA